jgi:hypothetical protein
MAVYFAVSNNILLTFGGDHQLTYTGTLAAPDWQSIPFTLEYNPIIMSTLPDGRVMIAAGSHRTYGFFTEEVMFMNTTGLLATISYPLRHQRQIQLSRQVAIMKQALTSGEMVAAIVVPIGFALIAAAILIVLLRRWKNRRRQGVCFNERRTRYQIWRLVHPVRTTRFRRTARSRRQRTSLQRQVEKHRCGAQSQHD